MTTTWINSATALSNTVAIPAHQAGDVIIAAGYRVGSTTPPTLPAGWISGGSVSISGAYVTIFAHKIAASSSETFGTWTNASSVLVVVLRPSRAPLLANASPTAVNSGPYTYPNLTAQAPDTFYVRLGWGNTSGRAGSMSGWTKHNFDAPAYEQFDSATATGVAASSIGGNSSGAWAVFMGSTYGISIPAASGAFFAFF